MSSVLLYNAIKAQNASYLENGNICIDDHLNDIPNDKRLGISLLIPINAIHKTYAAMAHEFSLIDPYQYYYPLNDIHITIFDFLKGSSNYHPDVYLEKIFAGMCGNLCNKIAPFIINFDGIVFCKDSLLIKGYDDGALVSIRSMIREEMSTNGIPLDERYNSESAHLTFCRFKSQLSHREQFARAVKKYSEYSLGEQRVDTIELVEHDWYNLVEKKRVIKTFSVNKS
jgi:2'-5' RNA ligase